MKLLKLTLSNFKGIRNFTLDTQGGKSVEVYGDNATGKTTLFDAFLWLLFDKDSANRKDFDIKTLDSAGQPLHGLEHSVEAVLEIDGKKLTLRKVFCEKWTRQRGSAEKVFTGHTTDYFIDGVPVKKNEYVDFIAEIGSEDNFKLLTSPMYFNMQLHWQERRKILLQVCGDVSDEEVITSNKALTKLPEVLQGRPMDKYKDLIKSRRSEINKELEKIPVRINEVQNSLPDIAGLKESEINAELKSLKVKLQEKNQEIAGIRSGGGAAELTKKLRIVEGELLDIRNQHRSAVDQKVQGKRDRLNALRGKESELQQAAMSKGYTVQTYNTQIKELEARNNGLREEWFAVDAREFAFTQETVCPTCGQTLPEEKLAVALEKAQADFNRRKAQELEEINAKGGKNKAEIDRLRAENATLEEAIQAAEGELAEVRGEVANLEAEIGEINNQAADITGNKAFTAKLKEKASLEAQISELQEGNNHLVGMVQEEIESLVGGITYFEKTLARVEQHQNGLDRIDELKQQEKALAKEYEKLERELYLTEEFTRTKVKLLDEKINGRFKYARFKLFNVLVNGAVEECCETIYQGVPYSSALNNAARINIGLDIINTLAEYYGFDAPIFIDNREAVTRLIATRGQMISLIVSEKDAKMRTEVETEGIFQREAV